MKAKTRLAIWLGSKKKDYREGLQIYKDLAVNVERIRFFDTVAPSNMHINMLRNDLYRYARVHKVKPMSPAEAAKKQEAADSAFQQLITKQKPKPKPTAAEKVVESRRVEIVKNDKVNYDDLPGDLKAVYDQFKGLYEQYDLKRAQMNALPETAEYNRQRKELAGDVIGLRNTIRANWDEIDKWATGSEAQKNDEQPKKPSGKMSKTEIEKIADPEVKALSKKMRIEANLKYIGRNQSSDNDATVKKVAERRKELDEWGVDYAELLKKNS